MPPLNHRFSGVEKAGTVHTVDISERNTGPDGEQSYDKDTHFTDTFESAVRIAMKEIGDGGKFKEMGTGMLFLYEPHEDGEKHLRATIRERRMHTTR